MEKTDMWKTKRELSTTEGLYLLERAISEGLSCSPALEKQLQTPKTCPQIFGRPSFLERRDPLSFLTGIGLAGLRGAGLLTPEDLDYHQLSSALRGRLSFVLHLIGSPSGEVIQLEGPTTGSFQLVSGSGQEALDLCMIAHKIGETSLTPGLHLVGAPEEKGEIEFLEISQLIQFLGSPDDLMDCPTSAQKMIFGKRRRVIPQWFHLDLPGLHGSKKDSHAMICERLAQKFFFSEDLPTRIRAVMDEFAQLTGRSYNPVSSYHLEDSSHVLLVPAPLFGLAKTAVDKLRAEKKKVGCASLTLIQPFPSAQIATLFQGKKAITFIDTLSSSGESPLYKDLALSLQKASENGLRKKEIHPDFPLYKKGLAPQIFCGYFSGVSESLTNENLVEAFENMWKGEKQKFLLGLPLQKKSIFPKQEILIQQLLRDYPKPFELNLNGSVDLGKTPSTPVPEPSLALRSYRDQGPPYSRLAGFYDSCQSFYLTDQVSQMGPSPQSALNVVPPATGHFRDQSAEKSTQFPPQFLPEKCTGCGQCFIHCPHSALPPIAIGCEGLLRGAIDLVSQRGKKITKLQPVIKNLSKVAGKWIKKAGDHLSSVADFLPQAFENLAEQMKLSPEDYQNLKDDFDLVLEELKDFPLAVTDLFFGESESQKKGTGEFFSLALDPRACTKCGLCLEVCEESAFEWVDEDRAHSLKRDYHIWETLPDTASGTIDRMKAKEDYPSLAAILLSRNFYATLMGGQGEGEATSGKGLVHLVTSVIEGLVQSKVVAEIRRIDELLEGLQGQIHRAFEDTLGPKDFSSLAEVLSQNKEQRLSAEELIQKLGQFERGKTLDTEPLRRKLELVTALKDLKWALSEGPTGMGRSRFSLAISPSHALKWAGEFPYNPFCSPALIDHGKMAGLTTGLFQGLRRHFLDNLRLVRRAELEGQGRYNPHEDAQAIAELDWSDLTEEEKNLLPPLIVVGDQDWLVAEDLSSISRLLSSGWPIKILLLDTHLFPPNDPVSYARGLARIPLMALAHRDAFVLQASVANLDHLFSGLVDGLSHPGPALFFLHAPQGNWPESSRKALESRTFPCLRFEPNSDEVFGHNLSLAGNPQAEKVLFSDKDGNCTPTFAHWAFTQDRFQSHFQPLDSQEPFIDLERILLGEGLSAKQQPAIWIGDQLYSVSPQMVSASRISLHSWRVVQEISGLVTPFTQDVKKRMEEEVAVERKDELDKLQQDWREKLENRDNTLTQETLAKLKNRLLFLSGYDQ